MRKQIYSALDIMDLKLNNICNVKQFDDIILSLEIRDNGKAIDLTDNTVTIKAIRQDKQVLEQKDNISLKNNIVTVKLKNEALASIGLTKFELNIKDTDGSISTATFSLNVEESISLENAIDNTTHKNIIELLQDTKIDNVTLNSNILTFYANKKEIANVTLPTSGSSSGTIVSGHDGKDGKDGISLDYKWNGTQLGIKKSNESNYTYVNLKGEKGDTGRNGTDGKDGIGLDYTWSGTYLGIKKSNETNYSYKDLQGTRGENGTNGQDGHTPIISIGSNGNWFIDGQDTGKPSRGAKGDTTTSTGTVVNGKDGVSLAFNWQGTSLGVKRSDQSTYTYENLKGEKGDRGEQGIAGANGKDGLNGKNGADGKDGVGLKFAWSGTQLGITRENQDNYIWKELQGERGARGYNGQDGKNGLSAYEIACQNGFTGNEKEWLQSLKGKDGAGGSVGDIQLKDITLDSNGLKTLNEKIAYQHNHQGSQVVCSAKSWANNKYILEDIIDYLGTVITQQAKDIEQLKKQISDIYITVQK